MSDTRTALLDEAISLVRTRGYSGFSYADLADAVGVRKASIHYHFPTKQDLGIELVEAYGKHFRAALDRIDTSNTGAMQRLAAYVALYREGLPDGKICVCAALAAEAEAVPEPVQQANRAFFSMNLAWLQHVLAAGREADELDTELREDIAARSLLSSLEGALIIARSLRDHELFDQTAAAVLDGFRPRLPA